MPTPLDMPHTASALLRLPADSMTHPPHAESPDGPAEDAPSLQAPASQTTATHEAELAARRAQEQAERLREIVGELGEDIAGPLTDALERLLDFGETGRLNRAGLRAIRQAVERAREAGMISQQLARLHRGVGLSPERLHLTHMLQNVLAHRARELHSRGIQVVQQLDPVEVVADASLLFALLNTIVDWALRHTHGPVHLQVDRQAWPPHGRLLCRFACVPADAPASGQPPAPLDGLLWRLVDESARALELHAQRRVEGHQAVLEVIFPRTVDPLLDPPRPVAPVASVTAAARAPAPMAAANDTGGVAGAAIGGAIGAAPRADAGADSGDTASGFLSSFNSRPLAGSHVLVVASRRDLRVQVREAIRDMGLVVDFVTSIDDAAEFCRESLPHAIIVESVLKGPKLQQLMHDIRAEVPEFVFIEVEEEGTTFQISSVSPTGWARVGRDALASALPSALVYELTRTM